jgi:[ribosomal protein S18]-alanine N-acetyltransferase
MKPASRMDGPVEGQGDASIRRMGPGDLAAVVAIETRVFTMPWSAATYRTLLARSDADVFVAEVAAEVVGYAAFWSVGEQGELGNLAVADGWRGRGVASALMQTVFDTARRRGVREVFLEVRVSNAHAQSVYAHHGFERIGRRRGYYTSPIEDAFLLRKTLD